MENESNLSGTEPCRLEPGELMRMGAFEEIGGRKDIVLF